MSQESTPNRSKALEGVHGVHVVPHSPFTVQEVSQHGEFKSSCENSAIGAGQLLLMQ